MVYDTNYNKGITRVQCSKEGATNPSVGRRGVLAPSQGRGYLGRVKDEKQLDRQKRKRK